MSMDSGMTAILVMRSCRCFIKEARYLSCFPGAHSQVGKNEPINQHLEFMMATTMIGEVCTEYPGAHTKGMS